MLSQKAKYALRALMMLAARDNNELVQIAEIAEAERIPRKFLEAILLELRKNGLLYAKRGKAGGYRLGRAPDAITFGEVIRIIDGFIAPIPCASKFAYRPCEECVDPATCSIRELMVRVRDAASAILDHQTLSDAVKRRRDVERVITSFDI